MDRWMRLSAKLVFFLARPRNSILGLDMFLTIQFLPYLPVYRRRVSLSVILVLVPSVVGHYFHLIAFRVVFIEVLFHLLAK